MLQPVKIKTPAAEDSAEAGMYVGRCSGSSQERVREAGRVRCVRMHDLFGLRIVSGHRQYSLSHCPLASWGAVYCNRS